MRKFLQQIFIFLQSMPLRYSSIHSNCFHQTFQTFEFKVSLNILRTQNEDWCNWKTGEVNGK